MEKRINGFFEQEATYEEAHIVLFGAGMDATTSYRPGTRFASSAMRQEFYGLETYSPYQDIDLCDIACYDSGDLNLSFGNVEKNLMHISDHCKSILSDEKIPCMIGGEHLVTLGAIKAIIAKYPNVHVMHFDAHCDLRDTYLNEALSHACVMRRVYECIPQGHLHQFGLRSGDREEFIFGKAHCDFHPYFVDEVAQVIKQLKDAPIYITIDLDVLDPSIFSGTGTPEAGGISFIDLLRAVHSFKNTNIVGVDLCELSPTYDTSGVSTAVANKLLREMLLIIGGKDDE